MELKQLILDNIFTILSSLFGGGSFLAYFFERNKRKNEDAQGAADALTKMQEAYDKFTQDSLRTYEELRGEVTTLKENVKVLTENLRQEQEKYNVLKNSYEKLKNSYDSLKKNFDEYKRNNKKTT